MCRALCDLRTAQIRAQSPPFSPIGCPDLFAFQGPVSELVSLVFMHLPCCVAGLFYLYGCLSRSSLQAVRDLAPSVQSQVAQHHPELPAGAHVCSLCVRYAQPAPFFAAKPAAANTVTTATATSATNSTTTKGPSNGSTASYSNLLSPHVQQLEWSFEINKKLP